MTTPVFPDSPLATARLTLRPFAAGDAAEVAAMLSDPACARWLPLEQPYTLAAARSWCESVSPELRARGTGVHWAAVETASARFVGSFGFNGVDWQARSADIAYAVHPAMRGRGLAQEAVARIVDWLLREQGFTRCQLRAAAGNRSSQKVAAAAGFTPEGVCRKAGFTHGGLVDLIVYSRLSDDL
ncbi:GNAT family protein [Streptomyces sp. NPDC048659]|uniref:GNAT family N-acetyltransferase n=1 Tax=Streptomyces sp. NPDC048659 TaxID=3155489 RepID=UPI0034146C59